jgi:hypothetical protein
MINECKMDEKMFGTSIKNACPQTEKDKVLISVDIVSSSGHWVRRAVVKHDDIFTAMQKTTSFSAAVATSLISKGLETSNKVLGCSDIPMDKFFDGLDAIGGICTKQFR